jgi:DNA polymerase
MPDNWETFLSDCDRCRNCPLGSTRRNVVVYRGTPSAPLMFIGEGPGAEEDSRGTPFVGQAGRLLDLLLEAQGFPESVYHIGNIVKCRPPENRVPTEEEAAACKPLLARQIRLVRPKVVVMLGATAYHYLTQTKDAISRVRGQWTEKNGYHMMPTFHPAYILRNDRERILLWQDLFAVRSRLEELGYLESLPKQAEMPSGRG